MKHGSCPAFSCVTHADLPSQLVWSHRETVFLLYVMSLGGREWLRVGYSWSVDPWLRENVAQGPTVGRPFLLPTPLSQQSKPDSAFSFCLSYTLVTLSCGRQKYKCKHLAKYSKQQNHSSCCSRCLQDHIYLHDTHTHKHTQTHKVKTKPCKSPHLHDWIGGLSASPRMTGQAFFFEWRFIFDKTTTWFCLGNVVLVQINTLRLSLPPHIRTLP